MATKNPIQESLDFLIHNLAKHHKVIEAIPNTGISFWDYDKIISIIPYTSTGLTQLQTDMSKTTNECIFLPTYDIFNKDMLDNPQIIQEKQLGEFGLKQYSKQELQEAKELDFFVSENTSKLPNYNNQEIIQTFNPKTKTIETYNISRLIYDANDEFGEIESGFIKKPELISTISKGKSEINVTTNPNHVQKNGFIYNNKNSFEKSMIYKQPSNWLNMLEEYECKDGPN